MTRLKPKRRRKRRMTAYAAYMEAARRIAEGEEHRICHALAGKASGQEDLTDFVPAAWCGNDVYSVFANGPESARTNDGIHCWWPHQHRFLPYETPREARGRAERVLGCLLLAELNRGKRRPTS